VIIITFFKNKAVMLTVQNYSNKRKFINKHKYTKILIIYGKFYSIKMKNPPYALNKLHIVVLRKSLIYYNP
jgi:hypothetical protein